MRRRGPAPALTTRFARDQRGVSAVEFALIAPIMILFYFGMVEFCQAFMAEKRMGRTAATVADLVAQAEITSAAEITDIFQVGHMVMRPFDETSLRQRVSSVTLHSDGQVRVDWSRGEDMTVRSPGSTVDIPEGLIAAGESLIMTEAEYEYDSLVDEFLPVPTVFSHTYYLRPRKVDQVVCADC